MTRLTIVAAFITSVSFSSRAASAGPVTFDQTNPFNCPNLTNGTPPNPNGCQSHNPYSRAIVQTFTPTASTLDYVEVWVHDVHDDAANSGSLAQLVIRSPLGTIIGTAQTSVTNHGYSPQSPFLLTFTFSTPVVLTPGAPLHSWQFLVPGGDTEGLAIFGTFFDTYLGGTGYSGGSDTGGDWFFGEGLQTPATASVPEPTASSLVAIGLAVSLFRHVRRRRA
ncbi:MAG TPA: hypothetical protein VN700_02940 [Vicinamibacterales bacterium]|nr:hypothetical protein [Vicinamibacterales bacterium]